MVGSDILDVIRERRGQVERVTALARLERVRLEVAIVEAAAAGVSQVAIAEAAGVSQPYVSQVLKSRAGRFVARSPLGERLAVHRAEVERLVAGVGGSNLAVFGSVARGEDTPDSDVDLLVDLPEGIGLIRLGRLESEISGLLDAPVDLVPSRLLKPGLRDSVQRDLVPL